VSYTDAARAGDLPISDPSLASAGRAKGLRGYGSKGLTIVLPTAEPSVSLTASRSDCAGTPVASSWNE